MSPHRQFRVIRRDEQLLSDDKRVILRYLDFGHPPRIRSIVRRVLKVPKRRIPQLLEDVTRGFRSRHRDLEAACMDSYQQVAKHLRNAGQLTENQKHLIGAYFTMEYSIEAAALFNPSIVAHPDQSGLAEGEVRFLMSLRATGEGHVSSIVFRRGVLQKDGHIRFDPPPRYAYSAKPRPDRVIEKSLLVRKCRDNGIDDEKLDAAFDKLPDRFSPAQLNAFLRDLKRSGSIRHGLKRLTDTMRWLAHANYELHYPEDCMPSETVIFPATPYESRGMEDVRLVQFTDDDGQVTYYGTYTAFDGFRISPMLLETEDFRHFHIMTLSGRYAKNKGMALFPRKVNGQYVMLSRHDGECLFVLTSRDLHVWNVSRRLQVPKQDWELVQVGNCGSPLETPAGWLVLTHGVGPLRQYCIGALLLDLNDPTKVVGRLREPMLVPTNDERAGYVPNVVYSCGSMIHQGRLIIPYAMSDSRTSFASVSMESLLAKLKLAKP